MPGRRRPGRRRAARRSPRPPGSTGGPRPAIGSRVAGRAGCRRAWSDRRVARRAAPGPRTDAPSRQATAASRRAREAHEGSASRQRSRVPCRSMPRPAPRVLVLPLVALALLAVASPVSAASVRDTYPVQSLGDRGTNVAVLQRLLQAHGATIDASANFGPTTKAAVTGVPGRARPAGRRRRPARRPGVRSSSRSRSARAVRP